jgi:hypothetical protein
MPYPHWENLQEIFHAALALAPDERALILFEWMEKAYAQHADGLVRLKEEVGFDNLRSDPRYADLLRRVGLPP